MFIVSSECFTETMACSQSGSITVKNEDIYYQLKTLGNYVLEHG